MIRLSTLLFFLFGWAYVLWADIPIDGFYFKPPTPFPVAIPVFMVSVALLTLDLLRRRAILGRLILVCAGCMLTILPYLTYEIAAHKIRPYANAHDGAVMTEAALTFLDQGQNPYAADYRDTPFGVFPAPIDQSKENPALRSYVYLPGYLLTSYPFFAVSKALGISYDQRYAHIAFFFLAAAALALLARNEELRLVALIGFALNPLFLRGFLGGYNDIQVFAPIALGFLLLVRQRFLWASVAFGFALAMKQQAWLLVPLFLAYLTAVAPQHSLQSRFRFMLARAWPIVVIAVAAILPFFLWAPQAFVDDVIRYPAGTLSYNFPIQGFGIGPQLAAAGLIESVWDTYRFWILQAAFGLPVLAFCVWRILRAPSVPLLALSYGAFLLVFWYFSRFFFVNYLAFLSLLFLVAYIASKGDEPQSVLVTNQAA